MDMTKEFIEFKCSLNEEKYGRIKLLLNKRRNENIIHPTAAFLNPAYMLGATFKETWEMKQGTNYISENLISETEREDFFVQVQVYHMHYPALFTTSARATLTVYHPRIWWEVHGDVVPVLQKYVIRILSQPCSSSSRERNWSAFVQLKPKEK